MENIMEGEFYIVMGKLNIMDILKIINMKVLDKNIIMEKMNQNMRDFLKMVIMMKEEQNMKIIIKYLNFVQKKKKK